MFMLPRDLQEDEGEDRDPALLTRMTMPICIMVGLLLHWATGRSTGSVCQLISWNRIRYHTIHDVVYDIVFRLSHDIILGILTHPIQYYIQYIIKSYTISYHDAIVHLDSDCCYAWTVGCLNNDSTVMSRPYAWRILRPSGFCLLDCTPAQQSVDFTKVLVDFTKNRVMQRQMQHRGMLLCHGVR